jgi:hypothetical protein
LGSCIKETGDDFTCGHAVAVGVCGEEEQRNGAGKEFREESGEGFPRFGEAGRGREEEGGLAFKEEVGAGVESETIEGAELTGTIAGQQVTGDFAERAFALDDEAAVGGGVVAGLQCDLVGVDREGCGGGAGEDGDVLREEERLLFAAVDEEVEGGHAEV